MTEPLAPVLIVDDDATLLAGLVRQLSGRFDIVAAGSGEAALAKVRERGMFAAVLCDMRMPGMDGVEVLRRMAELTPDTVRMMLTGNSDQKTAIEAINRGNIFRFFAKPTPAAVLAEGIEAAVRQHRLITAERQLLEETLAGSVALLTDVLALVAPDTFRRSRGVCAWARDIARHMKLDKPWVVEMAAELAHLGAIAVPPDILARHQAGQRLSPMEEAMIGRIPEVGAALIGKVPRLGPVAEAVKFQATWVRGAAAIPLAGRILHVLLQLDEIGSGTPSREAVTAMEQQQGRFDPAVLAAAAACLLGGASQSLGQGAEIRVDVPAAGIRAGDRLETDLKLENGRLVLAAGETITDLLFLRLQNIHATTRLQEPIRVRRQASGGK